MITAAYLTLWLAYSLEVIFVVTSVGLVLYGAYRLGRDLW